MNKPPLTLAKRFSNLVLNERTGMVVGSKLAATTGFCCALFWFNVQNYQHGFNLEQWGIFLGACGLWKVGEKVVGMKYGQANPEGGAQ